MLHEQSNFKYLEEKIIDNHWAHSKIHGKPQNQNCNGYSACYDYLASSENEEDDQQNSIVPSGNTEGNLLHSSHYETVFRPIIQAFSNFFI